MNTSTKQTENLAECGNKSKPLLALVRITKTEHLMKWIKINSEKDLPKNIHFRNHTEFWACAKGIVFKIYFYNSYGGKNYALAEYNDEKIRKTLRANNVDCMGEIKNLEYYAVIERPKSPYEN